MFEVYPAIAAMVRRFSDDARAATSVEYALIAVVMAIMLVSALSLVRAQIASLLSSSASALGNALAE